VNSGGQVALSLLFGFILVFTYDIATVTQQTPLQNNFTLIIQTKKMKTFSIYAQNLSQQWHRWLYENGDWRVLSTP